MLDEVLEVVLNKVVPKDSEREKIEKIAEEYREKVRRAATKYLESFEVILGGSVAKDTWLSGEADVDIFILMPPSISRRELEEIGLKIAEEALSGLDVIKRFAEHPYLEAEVFGIKISVVPAYKTFPGQWLSAVDRTPFHVEYVKKKLDMNKKQEVRLLKKFTKGIGVYGAEITIKGFSGYLCELLIIAYGSFTNLITQAANKWHPPVVLDIENHYGGNVKEIIKKFPHSAMIVIDPVDKLRNVAAAVSHRSLVTFISACRCFLKHPSINFFYPKPRKISLERDLKRHGSIIAIVFSHEPQIEDILYPQLERLARSITNKLIEYGFSPIRWSAFSDYKKLSTIFIELESETIPPVHVHMGPQFVTGTHELSFIRKNLQLNYFLWIDEDGRWKSIRKRKFVKVTDALKEILKLEEIIPRSLRKILIEKPKVIGIDEIKRQEKLRKLLIDFITPKEFWIEECINENPSE